MNNQVTCQAVKYHDITIGMKLEKAQILVIAIELITRYLVTEEGVFYLNYLKKSGKVESRIMQIEKSDS